MAHRRTVRQLAEGTNWLTLFVDEKEETEGAADGFTDCCDALSKHMHTCMWRGRAGMQNAPTIPADGTAIS